MSDIGALVERLVQAGVSISEASTVIAEAFAAGVASCAFRSSGAERQKRYRERKRNETVTNRNAVTPGQDHNETVTNRNESVTRDAASLSIDKKEEIKKEKKERARAMQLPSDWRPSPESWAEACELLGGDIRAEHELRKFKNHASEKGRLAKNWNSAWVNWAIKAVEYGGRNGHGIGQTRAAGAAGPAQTGADTILAGMGRIADRIAARKLAERQDNSDIARESDFGPTGPRIAAGSHG